MAKNKKPGVPPNKGRAYDPGPCSLCDGKNPTPCVFCGRQGLPKKIVKNSPMKGFKPTRTRKKVKTPKVIPLPPLPPVPPLRHDDVVFEPKKKRSGSVDPPKLAPPIAAKKPLPPLPPPLPIPYNDMVFKPLPTMQPSVKPSYGDAVTPEDKPLPKNRSRVKAKPVSVESQVVKPRRASTVESIRRKALLDLFVTPWTVGSGTIGLSLLLLSWAFGLGPVFSFLGLLGVLIGCGVAGSKFAFNLEDVVKNAADAVQKEAEAEVQKKLDELDEKLCRDKDPRDQNYLRDMRELFDGFMLDYKDGKLSEFANSETVEQVKALFDAVVKSLERAFTIWDQSRNLRGKAKELAQIDREQIIADVGKSVDHMGEIISGIRSLKLRAENGDLERLRENLDRQLNVAKRTQDQMDALNHELHERQ